MRRHGGRWLLGGLCVGLLVAGCGDDPEDAGVVSSVPADLTQIGEPGSDVSPIAASYGTASRDVFVQPVGGTEEPVSIGPVPLGPMPQVLLCSADHLTVSDSTTQARLDVETRTWETGPSNRVQMTDSFFSPISGRLASSPDGSTTFLQATGNRVIRQADAGLWEDTGVTGHVYSADAAVLVIGEDRTVTTVWPY